MRWRRRHCCSHIAGLIYLLCLLGVLLLLVHQHWLPGLASASRRQTVDVGGQRTTGARGNLTSGQLPRRLTTAPRPAFGTYGNASSPPDGGATTRVLLRGSVTGRNVSQAAGEGSGGGLSLGPYVYIINEPDKCPKAEPAPFLVLLIATEARQVEARDAIRRTWGNESSATAGVGVIRLFLLGVNEGELGRLQQRTLEAESLRHRDIIQQNFLDAYNNLTIKTLMGMNWVAVHCRRASYVMKTDSDMFVNTEYLVHKLLRPDMKPKKEYFTGNNMRGYTPNRNKNSKWYMSPELYPSEKYPTFCSGTGYVFSGDLAEKIYRVSLSVRRLHLEDVYVGMCLAKMHIEPVPPPNEFLFNHWRVAYSSCKYSRLITSHGFHPSELLKYWHHLQSNKHNACINSFKDNVAKLH